MGQHEIVKCKVCEEVIRQCRCMDPHKDVKWEVCGKCQAHFDRVGSKKKEQK